MSVTGAFSIRAPTRRNNNSEWKGTGSWFRATLANCFFHCTLHTEKLTLHITHCTLYITHYTLHNTHYTLQSTSWKLHTSHYTLHTAQYTRHTSQCIFCSVNCTLQNVWCAVYAAHCHVQNTLHTQTIFHSLNKLQTHFSNITNIWLKHNSVVRDVITFANTAVHV